MLTTAIFSEYRSIVSRDWLIPMSRKHTNVSLCVDVTTANLAADAAMWFVNQGTQLNYVNAGSVRAAQISGQTAVNVDPNGNALSCTLAGADLNSCSLICTANGNTVNELCTSFFDDNQWNIASVVGSGCVTFTNHVVPVPGS